MTQQELSGYFRYHRFRQSQSPETSGETAFALLPQDIEGAPKNCHYALRARARFENGEVRGNIALEIRDAKSAALAVSSVKPEAAWRKHLGERIEILTRTLKLWRLCYLCGQPMRLAVPEGRPYLAHYACRDHNCKGSVNLGPSLRAKLRKARASGIPKPA